MTKRLMLLLAISGLLSLLILGCGDSDKSHSADGDTDSDATEQEPSPEEEAQPEEELDAPDGDAETLPEEEIADSEDAAAEEEIPETDTEEVSDVELDGEGPDTTVKTLHFNLPESTFHHGETYVLHSGGQVYTLAKHDDASRLLYSEVFDALPENQDPTHYVEGVELPNDRVTRLHVTQHSDINGRIDANLGVEFEHALGMVHFHFPDQARKKAFALKRAKKGLKEGGTGDLDPAEMDTYGPMDIAYSIVFHHPELLNMDPDHGANIMFNHIYEAEGIDALASAIQAAGQYGWYEQVPILDEEDNQALDSFGSPMYSYNISPTVIENARLAIQNALNSTKNDPTLTGQSYHNTEGVSHLSETGEPTARSKTDGYAFSLGRTGFQSGLKTYLSHDGSSVTLEMRNDYVRHLSTFIEFYDENDDPVALEDWSSFFDSWADFTMAEDLESDSLKFLTMNNPVPTILGIPVAGDFNNTQVTFSWPLAARYAKLMAGGLGNGGTRRSEVEVIGATMTSLFELAIPTILLASSAGMGPSSALVEGLSDDLSLAATVTSLFYSLIWSHSDRNVGDIAAKLGVAAANFVWKNKSIRNWVVTRMASSEAEQGVPFVGWALWALDIGSTASALIQTSVEVATSPWIIQNTIAPTHDIKVNIDHDPDDYQFPATATHFKVLAKFTRNDTRVITVTLPVDPITGDPVTVSSTQTVTFEGAPAGGKFDLHVLFYSSTGWLAGQVEALDLANANDSGSDLQTVDLVLEENLVPLDENSIYHHKVKLAYGEVKGTPTYYWHGVQEGPTATYLDLSNVTTGPALSALGNVTISQKLGMLGYVWRAYSPGLAACPGNASEGHLYMIRNVNLAEDPNVGIMTTPCGYANQPTVLYDFLAPQDTAQNFLVIEKEGLYHVRRMTYANDGVMAVPTLSYGSFPIKVDSMVRHPSGVLIAINNNFAKMYSLELPADAVEDAAAPAAIAVAGPALHLDGMEVNPALLRHPVAIQLTPENSVAVLDDIHELTASTAHPEVMGRLKVFTPDGTPVPYFNGDYQLDLSEPESGRQVRYLDFGFESQGYIYVLSYSFPTDSPGYTVTAEDYHLDIYKPDGSHLVRTDGFAAARLTVDKWRNVFTANYEHFVGANDLTEPSVSEWIPTTPPGDEDAEPEN